MKSSSELKRKFEKVFDRNQSVVLAEAFTDAHSDLVTIGDFNELKGIVRELGVKVGELAEAQKRTETKVEELAEAQKRTEIKIEELAEAQKKTEISIEELTEAQKRTETSLERLIRKVDAIEERLEGVSNSVGYSLENRSYKTLPALLEWYPLFLVVRVGVI